MTGICPHCEQEVDPLINKESIKRISYMLVLCPNCMRILGVMQDPKK